jgi:hypothetical protein
MSNPSPTCTFNGGSTPASVSGGSYAFALANPAGANFWSCSCTSTDDTQSASSVQATVALNLSAKTGTVTIPAVQGTAYIFTSTVGVKALGVDANGVTQPSYTTTFKVNVPLGNGLNVLAAGETLEQVTTFGWIQEVNAAIRGASGGYNGNVTRPPLLAAWTQVNWGADTSAANSGTTSLPSVFLTDTTGASNNIRGLKLARIGSVGAAYTVTAAFAPLFPISSTPECGILITDGTKFITQANGSISGQNIEEVKTYATAASAPSNLVSTDSTFGLNGFIWYQIKSDLTHRTYSVSVDGVNFLARYIETIAGSTMVNTETGMGFYVASTGAAASSAVSLFSWLQTSP